ncbi:MAG TPA: SDR family NAD(P)-dependent oxidoreductase [Bauldia sp.]|nr:SDR family NAD(P)-dependent oxidoreductase [Bauldia sp.]
MADQHPAIAKGRAAVVTGGANGIGLAAARRFAGLGMKIAIADVNEAALLKAGAELRAAGALDVIAEAVDVSDMAAVQRFKDLVYSRFGEVAVLMNNAGRGGGGGALENYPGWQKVLGTNLWGVINGVQAFVPAMIAQGTPSVVINTGSKQGITTPPGDTAYNVSKAGVKVLTEGLQHTLRNTPGCKVTAHLLVPGWVHTGLTAASGAPKPAGAWWPDQIVDVLLARLAKGDFYIICEDNEVTNAVDFKRIQWAAGDITENRVPLSRWHPDYKDAFAKFLKQ